MAERYGFEIDIKTKADELKKLPDVLDKAEKGTEKLEHSAEKAGKEIERLGRDGSSAFKKFSDGAMAAFASVQLLTQGFTALRGVASSLKGFSLENMAAYETQLRAETQLGLTLKNQGYEAGAMGRLKELASTMQGRTMYGDEAFLGGFGELSTYLKDENALKKMAPLLADYAAGMTGGGEVGYQQMIDLATGLGKAIDGTYDNLRKKGFDTSELEALTAIQKSVQGMQGAKTTKEYEKYRDNLRALAVDYGDAVQKIVEANGEIDESMKVEALGRSLETWKGLAEEMAKTPMGQLTQIKNEIGDMREKLGKDMYMALGPVMEVLKQNMPKIEGFLQNIGDIAVAGVNYLMENNGPILEFLEKIGDTLKFVAEHVNDLFQAFEIAFGVGAVILLRRMGGVVRELAANLWETARAGAASATAITNVGNQANGAIGKLKNMTAALNKATTAGQKLAGIAGGALIGSMTDNPEGDIGTFAMGGVGAFAAGGIYGLAAYSAVQGFKGVKGQIDAYRNVKNTEKNEEVKRQKWDQIMKDYKAWEATGFYEGSGLKYSFRGGLQAYKDQFGGNIGVFQKFLDDPNYRGAKIEQAQAAAAEKAARNDSASSVKIDNSKVNSDNYINQENNIGAEFAEMGRILRENMMDIMDSMGMKLRFDATSMEVASI